MLDELDSLMRPLASPVGDAEELPPLPRDLRPSGTVTASLTVEEPAVEVAEKRPEEEPIAEEPRLFPDREPRKPIGPLWQEIAESATSPPPAVSRGNGSIPPNR